MEKKTFEQIHDEVKEGYGITGFEAINKDRDTVPIAIERYAKRCAEIAFNDGCKQKEDQIIEACSNRFGFKNSMHIKVSLFDIKNPYSNPQT